MIAPILPPEVSSLLVDDHRDPPVRVSADERRKLAVEDLAIRAEKSARMGEDLHGILERVTGDELAEIFAALVKAGPHPSNADAVRHRALAILERHADEYAEQAIDK
jgi:hypothetical protein